MGCGDTVLDDWFPTFRYSVVFWKSRKQSTQWRGAISQRNWMPNVPLWGPKILHSKNIIQVLFIAIIRQTSCRYHTFKYPTNLLHKVLNIYIYIYIYVLGTTIPFPQMSVFSALKLIWNLKQMWGSFKRHGIRTVANYGGGGRHVNKHKHTQWHVNLWSNLKLSSKLGKWRETFFSFRDNRSRILPQTAVMC